MIFNRGNKDEKEQTEQETPTHMSQQEVFRNIKSKKLICHFLLDKTNEVGTKKCKIYDQEVNWKKRIWPIDSNAFITDTKGIAHAYFDVNESTGALRFNKSYTDKCQQCSNKIGIDAVNARDLLKRKTITALWGIDSTHVMLLLILGIAMLIMGVALLYIYGEYQKVNTKLQQYLPPPPTPVKKAVYENSLNKEVFVNV